MNPKLRYSEEQTLFIDCYYAVREVLDDSQKGILFDLLVDFISEKKIPDIDDSAIKMSFLFFKNGLERVRDRYEQRCEINKNNANKRWGNL